jgi:hypothetical protein
MSDAESQAESTSDDDLSPKDVPDTALEGAYRQL